MKLLNKIFLKNVLLLVPGKNGFLLNNSAKIHPTLQTSTASLYSFQDNNNSIF